MKYKLEYAEMGDGDIIELPEDTLSVASFRIARTDADTGVTATKFILAFLVPVEE